MQKTATPAEIERDDMLAAGMERVTLDELCRRCSAIGYRVEIHSPDASHWTNLGTGNRYPGTSYPVTHAESGLSAFHVDAPRDANYRRLQEIRSDCFVYSCGRIRTI